MSCDEHVEIVNALEAGDMRGAARLMIDHIGHVELVCRARQARSAHRTARCLRPLQWARRRLAEKDETVPDQNQIVPIKKGVKR
jgi:hypothetical protein